MRFDDLPDDVQDLVVQHLSDSTVLTTPFRPVVRDPLPFCDPFLVQRMAWNGTQFVYLVDGRRLHLHPLRVPCDCVDGTCSECRREQVTLLSERAR